MLKNRFLKLAPACAKLQAIQNMIIVELFSGAYLSMPDDPVTRSGGKQGPQENIGTAGTEH
jgi:hypothetical protein